MKNEDEEDFPCITCDGTGETTEDEWDPFLERFVLGASRKCICRLDEDGK